MGETDEETELRVPLLAQQAAIVAGVATKHTLADGFVLGADNRGAVSTAFGFDNETCELKVVASPSRLICAELLATATCDCETADFVADVILTLSCDDTELLAPLKTTASPVPVTTNGKDETCEAAVLTAKCPASPAPRSMLKTFEVATAAGGSVAARCGTDELATVDTVSSVDDAVCKVVNSCEDVALPICSEDELTCDGIEAADSDAGT